MMTLRDLYALSDRLRSVPGTPLHEAATVARTLVADATWQIPEGAEAVASLVVLPAEGVASGEDARAAIGRLAQQKVTGVVVALPLDAWPGGFREAAAASGLPVLAPSDPAVGSHQLREHVMELAMEVQRVQELQIAQLERLVEQLESAPDTARDRLVRWLAEVLDEATVMLVPPGTSPPPVLAGQKQAERAYVQVRDGQTPDANVRGEHHVLLYSVGLAQPYEVLLLAAEPELTPHARKLTAQTARHIIYAQQRAAARQMHQAEMAVKVAILQHLMTGDVVSALRAAEALTPGQLSGRAGRMAILECARPQDRESLVAAVEHATGGRALVVTCPAVDRHVLAVIPKATARNDARARALLSPLAAREACKAVGMSTDMPYYATSTAYGTARGALAAARSSPDRVVVRSGGTALTAELPQESYAAWGASVNALVNSSRRVPEALRQQIVHTAEVALAHGSKEAGRLTGASTSTARRHTDAVMGAMGLDHGQVRDRAVAQLALLAPPLPPGRRQPVRPLLSLLRTDRARAWAEERMRPLEDQPELVGLLGTWLRCNAEQTATADVTPHDRNAVRRQLQAAAAALALPLTEPGGAGHDVLWALLILGPLGDLTMPDPARLDPEPASDPGPTPPHVVPAGIARVYAALCEGGSSASAYSGDTALADEIKAVKPSAGIAARANRAFALRTAAWLASRGIRQFLDIGAGLPGSGPTVHETVQAIAPQARVVYVDNDPTVLTAGRAMLRDADADRVAYTEGDIRDPAGILARPEVAALDWEQPVGILLNAVLHFVLDKDLTEILHEITEPAAPGSYVTLSCTTPDYDPQGVAAVAEIYRRHRLTATSLSRTHFARLTDGLDVVEPGIVPVHRWRPEQTPTASDAEVSVLGVVGRVP